MAFRPFSGSSRIIREDRDGSSTASTSTKIDDTIVSRMFKGKQKESSPLSLTDTFDIEKDFKSFKEAALTHFRADLLYKNSIFEKKTKLISKAGEIPLQIGDGKFSNQPLISKDKCLGFSSKGFKIAHLGLIIIGIKGMTKKELGCQTLVTIFDESLPKEKSIISFMEVDMSENRGLFYCAPDFFLETKDVHRIKIGVMHFVAKCPSSPHV